MTFWDPDFGRLCETGKIALPRARFFEITESFSRALFNTT